MAEFAAVTMVQIGIVPPTEALHQIVRPPARPVGGLVLTHTCLGGCEHTITYICSWQVFADLKAQISAWRDLLPVDLRDQFDALAAEVATDWTEQMRNAT